MHTAETILIRQHAAVLTIEQGLSACGVEGHDRVLVAVSGGADSTALLVAVHALATRRRWSLDVHAAHVHHHLRGGEADGDAEHIERLAAGLNVPFHVRHIYPGERPGNVEANARRLRYGVLGEVAGEIGADAVATAHHLHDQLETILLRLMRGAGAGGLGGIARRRRLRIPGDAGDAGDVESHTQLIRPMLDVRPDEGRELLTAHGIGWREDRTNADTSKSRAALRHTVLPALLAAFPGGDRKAGESAQLLRRLQGAHRRHTDELLAEHITSDPAKNSHAFPRGVARTLHGHTLAEVIRVQSIRLGLAEDRLTSGTLGRIVGHVGSGSNEVRRFHLRGGLQLVITADAIVWETASDPAASRP